MDANKRVKPALPPDCGFTPSQQSDCLHVLSILSQNSSLFESAPLRDLRKTLEPLISIQIKKRSKSHGGEKEDDPLKIKSSEAKMQRGRIQQKTAYDRELLNKRTLRKRRLEQLRVMNELDPRLPMIPDGSVFDGVNLSVGQSSGTSSCVAAVQNAKEDALRIENETGSTVYAKDELAKIKSVIGEEELLRPRSCYVCKCRFYKLHHFYDSLCPDCAGLNWTKRMQTFNMTGRVALLTGARVKVGYQIGLKLLRAGCTLVATSRFPADTAERFSKEPDFELWKSRLRIFGIDLRDLVALEAFCDELVKRLPRLDVIINNACQTVRRPPAYYEHLIANEHLASEKFAGLIMEGSAHGMSRRELMLVGDDDNARGGRLLTEVTSVAATAGSSSTPAAAASKPILSAELSQVPLLASDVIVASEKKQLFPEGAFDVNAQQVDMRSETTWTMRLHQVSTPEAVEVFAVNSLAPFVIAGRLKPLMMRTREMDLANGMKDLGRYIVNVSSMEGKFFRRKDVVHPHTNMAKAAMNMMTKTSGPDYATDNIYMTSVDTGWLSIEAPVPTAVKIAETNFQTPIDEVDGASRVLDPVFSGMAEDEPKKRLAGVFLKDYTETEW